MEKFTKWADRNGVNPFVPNKPKLPKTTLSRIAYVAFVAIIGIPKLLIALCLVIASLILRVCLSSFSITIMGVIAVLREVQYTSNISRYPVITVGLGLFFALLRYGGFRAPNELLLRFFIKNLQYLVLYFLGTSFEIQLAPFRRLGLTPHTQDLPSLKSIRYEGIMICNLTNILEIFFLDAFSNPIFVFPYKIDVRRYTCVEHSFLGALWVAAYGSGGDPPSSSASHQLSSIVSRANKARRPIVLFLEGGRTNGDGVLVFPSQVFEPLLQDESAANLSRVHLVGFSYPPPDKFSPANPIGSPVTKLFWLAGTTGWGWAPLYSVPVVCVPASVLPPLVPSKLGAGTDGGAVKISTQQLASWLDNLRDLFSQAIKKSKVALDVDDMQSFRKYYSLVSSRNNYEAKAYADARKKL